ncbi:MAG: non-heme iron oxygenase ferredoxin subunit [Nitrosomonadales bacterium]|nr:non-heme iron oxygenase ferredoxin subunit [Nitrosomonadales bacterium]
MSGWVDVAKAEEIMPGHPVHIEVDGAAIAVFKLDQSFYAIEDVCTHDGGRLTGGCVEHDQIVCPRHGARFSIRTGEALTAPAYEPTTIFPVRIENGVVQVRDDRWDE